MSILGLLKWGQALMEFFFFGGRVVYLFIPTACLKRLCLCQLINVYFDVNFSIYFFVHNCIDDPTKPQKVAMGFFLKGGYENGWIILKRGDRTPQGIMLSSRHYAIIKTYQFIYKIAIYLDMYLAILNNVTISDCSFVKIIQLLFLGCVSNVHFVDCSKVKKLKYVLLNSF